MGGWIVGLMDSEFGLSLAIIITALFSVIYTILTLCDSLATNYTID